MSVVPGWVRQLYGVEHVRHEYPIPPDVVLNRLREATARGPLKFTDGFLWLGFRSTGSPVVGGKVQDDHVVLWVTKARQQAQLKPILRATVSPSGVGSVLEGRSAAPASGRVFMAVWFAFLATATLGWAGAGAAEAVLDRDGSGLVTAAVALTILTVILVLFRLEARSEAGDRPAMEAFLLETLGPETPVTARVTAPEWL